MFLQTLAIFAVQLALLDTPRRKRFQNSPIFVAGNFTHVKNKFSTIFAYQNSHFPTTYRPNFCENQILDDKCNTNIVQKTNVSRFLSLQCWPESPVSMKAPTPSSTAKLPRNIPVVSHHSHPHIWCSRCVKSSCVKPFPGEAFTPQHWKRGKAAAYSPWYPRVLPDLLLPRRVSVDGCHNESQRTWLLAKKKWLIWLICLYTNGQSWHVNLTAC